jgi:anti-sigma regulatory factor (Ser/Thr protein kinase)
VHVSGRHASRGTSSQAAAIRYGRREVTAADLRHDLFVYDSDERLAVQVEQYLVAGIDAGEHVIAVVDERKQAILRDALGSDAELIVFADHRDIYTRPEAAMAAFDVAVRGQAAASEDGARVYGELPDCETRAEWEAWITYEAIVNRVFAGRQATLMCGYDEREVPEAVVRQAWRAHRVVLADAWQMSPEYEEPEAVVRSLAPAFEPLPGLRALDVGGRLQLQDRLADALADTSASAARTRDMLVAVREVLSNAEQYGNGVRALRLGQVGTQVVCEVTDRGAGFDDPLAGYLPPRPLAGDSAGLWIARQLTSRLELHQAPEGLTVRLWV